MQSPTCSLLCKLLRRLSTVALLCRLVLLLQVQEVLLDSTQSISRLREDVQSITSWVSQGKLADSLTQGSLLGPLAPKKRSAKDSVGKVATKEAEAGPQRVTRNAALPQPHFKVRAVEQLLRSPQA